MIFTRIGDQRDIVGESPLWDAAEQALCWVDIRRPALRRLDHASGRVDTRPVTTASQGMTPDELDAQPLAGALLAATAGVRGIPEPRWAAAPPRCANPNEQAAA